MGGGGERVIPAWVYIELPAFFFVGIVASVIFRWRAKTIIMFGLGVWWLGTLVDYFMIAPIFHLWFNFSTLCIGMGLCALCAWGGWLMGCKLYLEKFIKKVK